MQVIFKTICLLIFNFVVDAANPYLKAKPDWIKTCELKSPKAVECSTESIGILFEHLKTGERNIGLPPMDPLFVEEIKFSQGDGPVSLTASLVNATVIGFKDLKIVENIVHKENVHWTTHLTIPKLRIDGIYKAKGQILVVPIRGNGPSWFEVYDLDVHSYCNVDLFEKGEHLFYDVKSINVNFTFQDLKFYLSNLFESQKDLEVQTNKYLNDHWREVAPVIQPVIQGTIEEVALTFLKRFFDNCPAEYFIKDLPRNIIKKKKT